MLEEIERRVRGGGTSSRHIHQLSTLRFAPPVTEPSKVIALGRNYPSHAAEQDRTVSEMPLLFAKAPSSLIGHQEAVIVPPEEHQPDFEAEMALVIGRTARRVAASAALDHVAGITAFNDVSGREAQFHDRLWFRGKGYDTFGPVGPWVTTLDEAGDPDDLGLRMILNGRVEQSGRTSEMAFSCGEIIAFISRHLTLRPGDLIATGTPAGVGVFRDPPLFLRDGDRMEVELEGVGRLVNPVRRRNR